jgi:hypothetical protein
MSTFTTLKTELAARLADPTNVVWTSAQVGRFVNGAIEVFNERGGYKLVEDESLTTSGTVTSYTLPAAITNSNQVLDVSIEQATGDPYWRLVSWYASGTGTCTLRLRDLPSEVGKKIRVLYRADHPQLTGSDNSLVPSEWIYAYGKFLAHEEALSSPTIANNDWHSKEAKRAWDVATALLPSILPRRPSISPAPSED